MKKIEELELELELYKERMSIGSSIIKTLVGDTKDSMKFLLQSFDLITATSNSTFKGGKVKSVNEKGRKINVKQNVPKKVAKLVNKQKGISLKEVNSKAGKNLRSSSKQSD